ncbi:MAG: alpha-2-macroglobulin family protein [Myxococcaceae bacterium]
MKSALWMGGVALAVLIVAFFLGSVKSSRHGYYADALAGNDEGKMGNMHAYAQAAPAAPPPVQALEAMPEEAKPMAQKRMNTIQVIRGAGGGGMADGIGLGGIGISGKGAGHGAMAPKKMAPMKDKKEAEKADEDGEQSEGEGGGGAATRAWFPESFLFAPLVVTGPDGTAEVPVKVPDRLTSWRVLALAHSREGGQAGAVTSFLGTLPTYVDPVVPGFLMSGDEVRLPIQMVNTTPAAVATKLTIDAANATVSSHGGAVKVPAAGSTIEYVELKTPHPGTAKLRAALGSTDAIERTIDVKPNGKPKAVSAGGTLGTPRTLSLEGPANPLEGSEHVALQVYPGALSLIRSELSAAPGRGGVAEDAYTLLLLGRAPELLKSLGSDADNGVVRDLTVLASQRAIRDARSPSVPEAVLLAEAALAHPENPVLTRLGERLAAQVARAQRPDGTCEGANGWTLQRLLVTTAGCVQAVHAADDTPEQKQRAIAVAVKAAGAFERSFGRIDDGYTAAAILAAGAGGPNTDKLKALVIRDLKSNDDGSKFLAVASGVVRPDGLTPSTAEATAMAVLALQGDDKAPVADLGSWLLGNYSPVWGWGDGQANLVAMRAVTQLFKDKVPEGVKITLERDGKNVLEGTLDAAALKDVLSLDAPAVGSAGKHEWKVSATPAVPGLGFSLTLAAYVPWKDEPGGGLELTVKQPPKLSVGETAELDLVAAAPANQRVKLRLSLPAGVQHDTPSLDQLIASGTVERYETEDGAVTLHLRPLNPGATFNGKVKVVPTLAGTLHASANTMAPEDRPLQARDFAPATWIVH